MGFDPLEDVLAFLYATGGRGRLTRNRPCCPHCGAELEEEDEDTDMLCAECNEEIGSEDSDDC